MGRRSRSSAVSVSAVQPQVKAGPVLTAHSLVVFIGAFANSFLIGSMFAPALYARDYTVALAAVIGYLIYIVSTATAYTTVVIDLSIYVIGSISGIALGSTIGVSFAGYLLRPLVDFGVSLGKWLVGFAPYGTANILFYPLVLLAWFTVSAGITATIDSILLSVAASTLLYPYIASSVGLVMYVVAASFNLYMFAAASTYLVLSAAAANLYFWEWAIQAIVSDAMLVLIAAAIILFAPNLFAQFVSGITAAFIAPEAFGYTYEEWFRGVRAALFIWLGVDMFGFIAATILGLGNYFGYSYVESLRSLTVMGMMLFALAAMGTANWYAITLIQGKTTPRAIMRITDLLQPALVWSAVAFMIGYDFGVYVVTEAFNDIIRKLAAIVIRLLPII